MTLRTIFLLAIMMTTIVCMADTLDTRRDAVNSQLSHIPNYACFQETYFYEAQLPWEISSERKSKPFMMIRQSKDGVLFAQPVPDCEKRESCGYWIRSVTWKQNFIIDMVERIPCPATLTKQKILDLIKKEYSTEINLNYEGNDK